MKHEPTWTLGEVLDVECLCARGDASEAALRDRERLAREFSPSPLAEVPRPALFHRWLAVRRETEASFPGSTLDRIFRVGRFLAWLLGLLVGATTAGSYLLYYGREPVNPFWFVLWLVALPLLLTVALVILARAWHDWSGSGAVARWLVGALCRRLSGSAARAWQAWTGQWERHRTRHARLAMLPLLGITQRAACAFALGALLTLWLRIVFTDVVFGWQSSIGWAPEVWHRIAQAVALPWAWLFPSGCPSLEAVAGSHFTYAAGVAAIDPAAGKAWWPFLAGCLLFWGAAIRGAVVLWLSWLERQALRAPDFTHSDANALHRALTGPLFVSEAGVRAPELAASREPVVPSMPGRGWLVLSDLPGADAHVAEAAVAGSVGGQITTFQPVAIDDPGANTTALAEVAASPAPVAILLPASRDPIVAIKKTLAAIAAAAAGRECVVLLRGDAARLPLWRKFAAAHRLEMEFIAVP